jgi:hypothetical protein
MQIFQGRLTIMLLVATLIIVVLGFGQFLFK